MQSDSDWAAIKSTRKSVSAGNIRCGQHVFHSWSNDQAVIAMSSGEAERYAACMATQQVIETESMGRVLGVHLDAMELQEGANAAIGIMGKQGLGNVSYLNLGYLWLHQAVLGKKVTQKTIKSESNMAHVGTNALEEDTVV